jgi:hypothetical protein
MAPMAATFFHQASRRNFKSYYLCQVASSAQTRPSHAKMRRNVLFHGGSRNYTDANASYSIWRRPRMDGRTGWTAANRTHIPSLVSPHNPFLVPIEVKFERKFSSAPFRGHVNATTRGSVCPLTSHEPKMRSLAHSGLLPVE